MLPVAAGSTKLAGAPTEAEIAAEHLPAPPGGVIGHGWPGLPTGGRAFPTSLTSRSSSLIQHSAASLQRRVHAQGRADSRYLLPIAGGVLERHEARVEELRRPNPTTLDVAV